MTRNLGHWESAADRVWDRSGTGVEKRAEEGVARRAAWNLKKNPVNSDGSGYFVSASTEGRGGLQVLFLEDSLRQEEDRRAGDYSLTCPVELGRENI